MGNLAAEHVTPLLPSFGGAIKIIWVHFECHEFLRRLRPEGLHRLNWPCSTRDRGVRVYACARRVRARSIYFEEFGIFCRYMRPACTADAFSRLRPQIALNVGKCCWQKVTQLGSHKTDTRTKT